MWFGFQKVKWIIKTMNMQVIQDCVPFHKCTPILFYFKIFKPLIWQQFIILKSTLCLYNDKKRP
jgi:hypothetical protein